MNTEMMARMIQLLPRTADDVPVVPGDIVYGDGDRYGYEGVCGFKVEPFHEWSEPNEFGDGETGVSCWMVEPEERGFALDLMETYSTHEAAFDAEP